MELPTFYDCNAEAYYRKSRILARQARQLLYPRRCSFCLSVLGFVESCDRCKPELTALERKPSKRLDEQKHYMGKLDGAAAVFSYEGIVRRAVLHAKYGGEAWAAEEMGVWTANYLFGSEPVLQAGVFVPQRALMAELGYDVIVPVPSSGRGRGYNVPQIMALPISKALEIPLESAVLSRRLGDKRQAGLALKERLANVAGAFRVQEPSKIEGKRVLLVDDIITTGATAAACAQALLDAGAESVFAVAFATVE